MKRHWVVPVIIGILILGLFPLNNAFAAVFTDSFSIAAQESNSSGVAFSADGLTMFVVGTSGDDVNEYACGGAFDVSTCSFTDSFSVAAQETSPQGVAFSADGLTMFVVGNSGRDVNEYACGTLFDVSTCVFAGNAERFSVSTQEILPRGVAFSANGLTMFVVGGDGDDVNEYACGTLFDVSTCAFTDSFSVVAQETFPTDIAFSADGLTMFVVGSADDVNEYACGGAFDVSTCAFTDSFDVSAQETDSSGIAFSADGLTMFVVGGIGDAVHEYALGTAFDVSSVPEEGGFGGPPIGGISIPIDTTALLVAGVHTMTPWLILVVISAVGIGLAVFTLKRSR